MRTSLTLHKTVRPLFFCLLAAILMSTLINAAIAQESTPQTNKQTPLIVKEVKGTLMLYHAITVQVEGLDKWVEQAGNDYKKFVLYVDGNPLNGLVPTITDNDTRLQYDLNLDELPEAKKSWIAASSRYKRLTREVPVTVQHPDIEVNGEAMATLTVIHAIWLLMFVILGLAGLIFFLILARRSDILRDPGPQPEGLDEKGQPNRKPYSLARTQMALWFLIIIISYVFIWMVTGDLDSLTTSVLGLMGISAGTGLGAAVVDSGKQSDIENQLRALKEKKKSDEVEVEKHKSEINTLTAALGATPPPADVEEQKTLLASTRAGLAAKQKEIEQANEKIAKLSEAAKPAISKSFFLDVLSDDNGVSFHRFQIFAWTLVLICIFIAQVRNVLSMPEFDATLLGLMGISSGTYIGFKIPSQQG